MAGPIGGVIPPHPILRNVIESAPAYRMPAAVEDRIFLLGRTLHPDGEYAWSEVIIREIGADWSASGEQLLHPKAY